MRINYNIIIIHNIFMHSETPSSKETYNLQNISFFYDKNAKE